MGYDNFKKKYVMSWIDDTGTAVYTAEGTADKSGKVITHTGLMDDPATGERKRNVKYVTRIIDKGTQVFEMYDMGTTGDRNYKAAEITYSRVK